MWLSIKQGADYLVRTYGPRALEKLQGRPPSSTNADGQRGYLLSDLDTWAKYDRSPPVRGKPVTESRKSKEPPVKRATMF